MNNPQTTTKYIPLWSCCGDDMRGTIYEDIQRCPTCKEGCCGEEEES